MSYRLDNKGPDEYEWKQPVPNTTKPRRSAQRVHKNSTGALQWRQNERNCVSNRRRLDCLFNRLFRCRSKKTSKLHVTGICEGNSPVTDEFPAQRASYAENVSICWRHHGVLFYERSHLITFRKIQDNIYIYGIWQYKVRLSYARKMKN